jgi:hypothetical protein
LLRDGSSLVAEFGFGLKAEAGWGVDWLAELSNEIEEWCRGERGVVVSMELRP